MQFCGSDRQSMVLFCWRKEITPLKRKRKKEYFIKEAIKEYENSRESKRRCSLANFIWLVLFIFFSSSIFGQWNIPLSQSIEYTYYFLEQCSNRSDLSYTLDRPRLSNRTFFMRWLLLQVCRRVCCCCTLPLVCCTAATILGCCVDAEPADQQTSRPADQQTLAMALLCLFCPTGRVMPV